MPNQEARIQEIGREIFAKSNESRGVFNKKFFSNKLLAWSMSDERLKLDMFRFVDVLPMLGRSGALNAHFREYLLSHASSLPTLVKFFLNICSRLPLVSHIMAFVIRKQVFGLAQIFIAGANASKVAQSVTQLWRDGFSATVDILGEAAVSEAEAKHYQQQYCELVAQLALDSKSWPENKILEANSFGPLPRANVSVKCSSLCSQISGLFFRQSVENIKSVLRPILAAAKQNGVFVYLDMEQFDFHDIIMTVAEEIFCEPEYKNYPHLGIVIQNYLKCALEDVERIARLCEKRGTPLTVRMVKGAYWDYETVLAGQRGWASPVFATKPETDANFELCVEKLLSHYPKVFTALGSHNVRSVSAALAAAEVLNIPKNDIELQLLYGMADTFKLALRDLGYRVREYAPMGAILPGMAYLVRRLLENTANQGFMRESVSGNQDVELLLRAPQVLAKNNSENQGDVKMNAVKLPVENQQAPNQTANFVNEPYLDFALPENRDWTSEFDALRKQFPITVAPMISGKQATAAKWDEHKNPSKTSETVCRYALSTPAQAEVAIVACEKAKDTWGTRSVTERAAIIHKAAELMLAKRRELTALITLEVGKPLNESDADVCEAIDFCRYYADELVKLDNNPHRYELPGEMNRYYYGPRGTAVTIAPWNFPLAILCGMTVAPLVCGNPVIMKPAEQSSAIAKYFYEILIEAGVTADAIHLLPGLGEEVGAALVKHPKVHVITFTGSRNVGLSIIRDAALPNDKQRHIKKVVAELGGKNAVIVDEDADLDEAVTGCLQSVFGFSGQKCSALSRIILLKPVFERFKERFVAGLQGYIVGPVDDTKSRIGPVIDSESRDRLLAVIERNKNKIVYQMELTPELLKSGNFVTPTVFADTDPNSELGQKEFFGPLVTLFSVNTLDEAIRVVNDVDYALTGGVFSRSPKNIDVVKKNLEVGNLYVNRGITGAQVCRQPFGGFKLSGCGAKAGGPDYLLNFLEPKTITENTMRRGFV